MNPNILGILPVFIWGVSIPLAKMLMLKIGFLAVIGFIQIVCGVLGLLNQRYVLKKSIPAEIFRSRYFYLRGAFFVGHVFLIFLANAMVRTENISLVILLNYFWPTAIILSSIWLAGVRVTRPVYFTCGILLVLVSLSMEILKPESLSMSVFDHGLDRIGYGIAFIAATFWGLYSAISRKAGEQTGGSAAVPFYQLTLAITLPVSFLPGMAHWDGLDAPTAGLLLGYALLMFIAYLCWDLGMRKGNIVFLSLCADFVPWISLTTAWLLLDAEIGPKTIFAGVMLVFGAIITRYGTLAKKPVAEDPPPD